MTRVSFPVTCIIAQAVVLVAACGGTSSTAPTTAPTTASVEASPEPEPVATPAPVESYELYLYVQSREEPSPPAEAVRVFESDGGCDTLASSLEAGRGLLAVGLRNPRKVDLSKFTVYCDVEEAGARVVGAWLCFSDRCNYGDDGSTSAWVSESQLSLGGDYRP